MHVEPRHTPPGVQCVRRSFLVTLEHGLHARPCAVLIKTLQPYRAHVEVEANGEKASGRSILGLMALGVGHGSKITFTMLGHDAPEAMAQVEELFRRGFDPA